MARDTQEQGSCEPTEVATPSVADPTEASSLIVAPDAEIVPVGVFKSTDPIEALEEARRLVNYVDALIDDKRDKYIATIDGHAYPMHTWWSAVAAPLGLGHDIVWVKPFEGPHIDKEGYVARCVVFRRDGSTLGSAEAVCMRGERKGPTDTHAIMQKAETRAFVAAHRRALALLPVLAGLHAVSAEEVQEQPFDFVPQLDLEALPDDVKIGLKNLGWGANKARIHLANFFDADGVIDEAKAVAFLSKKLDAQNGGAR